MALQLNETAYEEFYGRNVDEMPKLVAQGLVPLGFADLMRRRVWAYSANPRVRESWVDNWFDSGDLCIVNANGKVKVALDSPEFRAITPKSTLQNNGFVLEYATIVGDEFTSAQVARYTGYDLSKRRAKTNPFWRSLARGDQALLDEYVDRTFAEGKARWGYDTMMGVYLPKAAAPTALGRPWTLGKCHIKSHALGDLGLSINRGRLVGVAPAALATRAERMAARLAELDEKVQDARADCKRRERGEFSPVLRAYK